MGWGAGRKLWEVLDNTVNVLAVEALCAAQGIAQRAPAEPSPAGAAAVELIRQQVPELVEDRPVAPDIAAVAALIRDGTLVAAVRDAVEHLA